MSRPEIRQPEVTIVVPVYNRSALIGRCLDSIKAQTHRPLRLIVVDNNSADNSLTVIQDWKERNREENLIVDILTETIPGASAARNRGLKEVKTAYTLFFDSDDEMHPRLVEQALRNIGDADLVYWRAEVIGLDGKSYEKPFHRGNLVKRHFYNAQLSTQQYMARTSLFQRLGGWNTEALVWNDWEIGIRITMMHPKAVAVREILVTIHSQPESITGRRFIDRKGDWEKTLQIVEKTIKENIKDPGEKKKWLRMHIYRQAILAAQYSREGDARAAKSLLTQVLLNPTLTPTDRIKLKFIYRYTAKGGRGAYYLW